MRDATLCSVLAVLMFGSAAIADGEKTATPARKPPVALNKQKTVILDIANKRVLVKSKVVLREGILEMFLCPKETKEHESILATNARAFTVHVGLQALGAKPGKAAGYKDMKFVPPTGDRIEINILWKDAKGKEQRASADSWVRHATRRFRAVPMKTLPKGVSFPQGDAMQYDDQLKELYFFGAMTEKQRDGYLAKSKDATYQKAVKKLFEEGKIKGMKADFVFAGSQKFRDDDGVMRYRADGGEMICLANFPTAMIDITTENSNKGNENLLFEAWTERVPKLGTAVTVELKLVPKKKKKKK